MDHRQEQLHSVGFDIEWHGLSPEQVVLVVQRLEALAETARGRAEMTCNAGELAESSKGEAYAFEIAAAVVQAVQRQGI